MIFVEKGGEERGEEGGEVQESVFLEEGKEGAQGGKLLRDGGRFQS